VFVPELYVLSMHSSCKGSTIGSVSRSIGLSPAYSVLGAGIIGCMRMVKAVGITCGCSALEELVSKFACSYLYFKVVGIRPVDTRMAQWC
jgi:hypothetical protein